MSSHTLRRSSRIQNSPGDIVKRKSPTSERDRCSIIPPKISKLNKHETACQSGKVLIIETRDTQTPATSNGSKKASPLRRSTLGSFVRRGGRHVSTVPNDTTVNVASTSSTSPNGASTTSVATWTRNVNPRVVEFGRFIHAERRFLNSFGNLVTAVLSQTTLSFLFDNWTANWLSLPVYHRFPFVLVNRPGNRAVPLPLQNANANNSDDDDVQFITECEVIVLNDESDEEVAVAEFDPDEVTITEENIAGVTVSEGKLNDLDVEILENESVAKSVLTADQSEHRQIEMDVTNEDEVESIDETAIELTNFTESKKSADSISKDENTPIETIEEISDEDAEMEQIGQKEVGNEDKNDQVTDMNLTVSVTENGSQETAMDQSENTEKESNCPGTINDVDVLVINNELNISDLDKTVVLVDLETGEELNQSRKEDSTTDVASSKSVDSGSPDLIMDGSPDVLLLKIQKATKDKSKPKEKNKRASTQSQSSVTTASVSSTQSISTISAPSTQSQWSVTTASVSSTQSISTISAPSTSTGAKNGPTYSNPPLITNSNVPLVSLSNVQSALNKIQKFCSYTEIRRNNFGGTFTNVTQSNFNNGTCFGNSMPPFTEEPRNANNFGSRGNLGNQWCQSTYYRNGSHPMMSCPYQHNSWRPPFYHRYQPPRFWGNPHPKSKNNCSPSPKPPSSATPSPSPKPPSSVKPSPSPKPSSSSAPSSCTKPSFTSVTSSSTKPNWSPSPVPSTAKIKSETKTGKTENEPVVPNITFLCKIKTEKPDTPINPNQVKIKIEKDWDDKSTISVKIKQEKPDLDVPTTSSSQTTLSSQAKDSTK